jgi:uncharacterized membrane protein
MTGPLTTNDGVVFGFLCLILAFVFQTARSQNPYFRRFYGVVPPLLICYFAPSLLTSLGIYDPEQSNIYYVASRFLLPASLVLLTVGTDLKEILRLGPKAITVFLAGTIGVVIGGPVSLFVMQTIWPSAVAGFGDQEIWRGMATVAGSWIGGGANQTAMKEVFEVQEEMFSAMITVDVLVANVWMAFLLFGVPRAEKIDRWNRADASMIAGLKEKLVLRQEGKERIPQVADLFLLLAVGFGVTAVAHFFADLIAPWISAHAPGLARFSLTSPFFWLVVIATAGGIILSITKASQLESVGASKLGTVFLYVLIASIGMKMDVFAIFEHMGLFVMGMIWMLIHGLVLFTVAWIVKAPFFLVAVGSQANIGGAASAPVVAGAFHPSLAPIGVLLAVLGYGVGTYAAYFCAQLMRVLSGG